MSEYQLPAECRCACGCLPYWRHRGGDLRQCDNCLTEAVQRLNPGEPAGLLCPPPYARIRNVRDRLADGLPIEAICQGIASMAVEVSDPTWGCCGEMHVSGWPGTGDTRAEAMRDGFDSLWHEGLIRPAIAGVWPFNPSGPHLTFEERRRKRGRGW